MNSGHASQYKVTLGGKEYLLNAVLQKDEEYGYKLSILLMPPEPEERRFLDTLFAEICHSSQALAAEQWLNVTAPEEKQDTLSIALSRDVPLAEKYAHLNRVFLEMDSLIKRSRAIVEQAHKPDLLFDFVSDDTPGSSVTAGPLTPYDQYNSLSLN